MKKYIVTQSGQELTEKVLESLYRLNGFATFNERDYNEWKSNHLEQGTLKVAK